MGKIDGCCCGFVFGMVLALLLLLGGIFWVCCTINPELKESTVEIIDTQLNKLKSSFDGNAGQSGQPAPENAE